MATGGTVLEERLCIDDPVGAFPTHALASIWGLVATGLLCERTPQFARHAGLLKGGTWKFLGIQILSAVCISAWAAVTTFVQLYIIDKIIGLRMSEVEEEVGADYFVHHISYEQGVTSDMSNANENEGFEEDIGRSTEHGERTQSVQEGAQMECPPVDMKNLQEINSRGSFGRRIKTSGNANGVCNNKNSLRVAPYLEAHAVLPKRTSICGYHSC